MEAFGRGLVSEPYLSTVVIGAALIAECGSEAQKQAILPKVADGSLCPGVRAFGARGALRSRACRDDGEEDGRRLAPRRPQDRRARRQCRRPDHRFGARRQRQWRIRQTVPVPGACEARPASRSRDYARLGGGRACNLDLTDVRLPADALLGDGSDALPAIEAVVDRAMAALGAEAVGIMQTLLDMTLEYTKIRKQFGRPLSANQVIRHRLADMAMQCDEARSIALRAALMVGCRTGRARPRRLGREGKDRQMRALRRRAVGAASRRHGRHRRTRHRLLFQAAARLRHAVRRQRPSLSPSRRARRTSRYSPERSATMDLTFSAEERAFEKEVRDFIAANLTPEMKRATALTPSVFSDPDIGMAWQRALHKKGWGAPGWPVEHGGPDWTPAQRWIFEAECARGRRAQCQRDGRQDGRPRHHRLRLAGAEEFLPAADSLRRGLLVPGLFRARLRLRPRLAENPRGARRRRLHHQRHQDLDHACPPRQPHVRAGAHQRRPSASRTASASS